MEGIPFPDAVIADWTFLDSSVRSQCPNCKKSRKYYCYSCYSPLPHLTADLPKVKLPVKVDIIKHPSETDGKSTAPHAAILAPEDVVIHTYPCIPDYDTKKVVLVFPGEESLTLEELAAAWSKNMAESSLLEKNDSIISFSAESRADNKSTGDLLSEEQILSHTDDKKVQKIEGVEKDSADFQEDNRPHCDQAGDSLSHKRSMREITDDEDLVEFPPKKKKVAPSLPFGKVVFIDSTWNQTHNIISDERLKDLKRVELRTRNSNFWRTQEGIPKTYLSTIEAIFYFFKDLHALFLDSDYKNEYDNLLFFFCYMHNKIQKSSKGGKGIKESKG